MTIRRLALAVPMVAVAWLAVLAVVMRMDGSAPAAFVPFPPAGLLSGLPAGVAVTDRTRVSVTLKGKGAGLTAQLYGAGAWLVLPAGLDACIPNLLRPA